MKIINISTNCPNKQISNFTGQFKGGSLFNLVFVISGLFGLSLNSYANVDLHTVLSFEFTEQTLSLWSILGYDVVNFREFSVTFASLST